VSAVADPAHALTPTGNLRRRLAINRAFLTITVAAATLAVVVLLILLLFTAVHGISALSFGFLIHHLPPGLAGLNTSAYGILPSIVATLMVVVIATLIAVPVGVLSALALTEFAPPRLANALSLALELMSGLDSIIIGIFISGLMIDALHLGFSAISGGMALSLIMLPLVTRATIEALSRVPATLRDAADALGVARWRTVIGVTIPTAAGTILTATVLAIARAAGETAPVLFTTSSGSYAPGVILDPTKPVLPLPLLILNQLELGNQSFAWGAAFVLILLVLVLNIGARLWLRRSERKRGQ
jgi:phosphate transport system permease protein